MAPGQIEISSSNSQEDLHDLAAWLRSEDELRGRVQMAVQPIATGHMGGIVDAVSVAVASGGAITVLAQSLFAWLSTRQGALRTKLTLKTESGREVVVDLSSAASPQAVLDTIVNFFQAGE